MAAKQIEIADAIKDLLNDDGYGSQFESFTAVRTYLPDYGVEELTNLTVVVVPGEHGHQRLDRAVWFGNFTTYIGVLQKIDPTDDSQIDRLQELVWAIIDRIKAPANAIDISGCALVSVSAGRGEAQVEALPFLLEHLRGKHTFTSVVTVVHRVKLA